MKMELMIRPGQLNIELPVTKAKSSSESVITGMRFVMAKREYCSTISEELEYWSERLHLLSGKFEKVPSTDKYKVLPHIEDLHIMMTEMDDRLCELMTSCSTVESLKEGELHPTS